MRLAIIGATGMVGREILNVLSERNFCIKELTLVASEKSCGKTILFEGKNYRVISLRELLSRDIDLALFSAGAEISKIWAPRLAEKNVKVIDNSSFWRMCSKHKLIVPEINGKELTKNDMIISNPNCSTIQLVMVLAPLHNKFGIKRVVLSTYQAVSGTGKNAVEQLKNEQKNIKGSKVYAYQIYNNVLPQCDVFEENGYTKEEMKLTNETKKILDEKIDVVATAVRVPVLRGHSESINIMFENDFDLQKIKFILNQTKGVIVMDDTSANKYPTPIHAYKKDEVFVGRIRKDLTHNKALNLWVVADNLRKGAATNTVQIAEYLVQNNLV